MAAELSNDTSDNQTKSIGINGHNLKTPFLIGVAGGTASGKSTVCAKIMEKLGQDTVENRERRVACISQHSFYRDLTDDERALAFKGNFNFDHPSAFDEHMILETLKDILDGKEVHVPEYNYKENTIDPAEGRTVYPADVVLFEGILVFYFPEIRDLFHMKLFVDTDADIRLARRVRKDIQERNRDLQTVLNQYIECVKPAFEEFCLPTKKYADIIIPRGADNIVAIDLIVQTIKDLLQNTRVQSSSSSTNQSTPNLQAQFDQFRRSRHMSDSRVFNRSVSATFYGSPPSSSSNRPH